VLCVLCAADYNFDHPDAFDHAGLLQCLKDLKVGGYGRDRGTGVCRGFGCNHTLRRGVGS
jgi:hypothetical protein